MESNKQIFDDKQFHYLMNYYTISDLEVEDFKNYIRLISGIDFDKLTIYETTIGIETWIWFIKNGHINENHYISIYLKNKEYKINENFKYNLFHRCYLVIRYLNYPDNRGVFFEINSRADEISKKMECNGKDLCIRTISCPYDDCYCLKK